MPSTPANTAFVYLYRDADNYKKWGEVVFAGEYNEAYEEALKEACQAREFFVAEQVRISEVFLWQEDGWEPTVADHGWHQFWELNPSDEMPDDAHGRRIGEFVEEFCKVGDAGRGWAVKEPGVWVWD